MIDIVGAWRESVCQGYADAYGMAVFKIDACMHGFIGYALAVFRVDRSSLSFV